MRHPWCAAVLLCLGACSTGGGERALGRVEESLDRASEREEQAGRAVESLFRSTSLTRRAVEAAFDRVLPACTGYHDAALRLAREPWEPDAATGRALALFLARYAAALLHLNVFLTTAAMRAPGLLQPDEEWYLLLVAHLRECVRAFREDRRALARFCPPGRELPVPETPFLGGLLGGVTLIEGEEDA